MWYWGSGTPWWSWLIACISMLVFWGLVIWVIWYVAAHSTRTERGPREGGPDRILDERLARGEIGTDEYTRLRDTIRGNGALADNGRSPASTGTPR
jgi:putative membrane protein